MSSKFKRLFYVQYTQSLNDCVYWMLNIACNTPVWLRQFSRRQLRNYKKCVVKVEMCRRVMPVWADDEQSVLASELQSYTRNGTAAWFISGIMHTAWITRIRTIVRVIICTINVCQRVHGLQIFILLPMLNEYIHMCTCTHL